MKISNFNPLGNTLALAAGMAIAKDDLVYIHTLQGKAFKAINIDTSVVSTVTYGTGQTTAATGMIVAQTSITAGGLPSNRQRQNPIYKDGCIFIAGNQSGLNGCALYKYSASGALLGSVVITSAAAACGRKLILLSNGYLAVIYDENSSSLFFQIINPADLSVIKTATTIASGAMGPPTSNMWDAIALSAGGFAVIFASSTANLDKYGTYDNAGAAVTAVMTINTRTGTSGAQRFTMKQLSDGNIAIAQASSNTVSSIGGYYSVISVTGTSIKAFTQVPGVTTDGAMLPCLEVMNGYFCVGVSSSVASYLAVFNNAGTLQGAVYTQQASSSYPSNLTQKIITDGTYFYFVGLQPTGSKTELVRMTIAGAVSVSDITPSPSNGYWDLDLVYDPSGFIVGASHNSSGNSAPVLWVVSATSLKLVSSSATSIGVSSGVTSGGKIALTNLGDGAFVAYYSHDSTANNCFVIGKWASTALIGVAATAAAANDLCPLYQGPGAYKINAIYGLLGKAFDMTTTTQCYGNKGFVAPNSAVLKGV